MGLCLSANCLAEFPVFYFSGPIVERLGVERAFTYAMVAYVLRLCAYIVSCAPWETWICLIWGGNCGE